MKKFNTIIKTLLIGALGGTIFNVLLFPLPWVLGPAFFVAVFALMGVEVNIPQNLRNPFIGIIGIWLGKSFSSSVFLVFLNNFIIFVCPFFIFNYLFISK